MQFAVTLKSSKFDVSQEDDNPINPIYGQSLLQWLRKHLSGKLKISEPEAEDWGWYSFVDFEGRSYMLGSTVFYEKGDDPNAELEWVFQVEKQRSLKEKLLGRQKMTLEDGCLQFFNNLFEEQGITVVSID
jgi:hypothetical protein